MSGFSNYLTSSLFVLLILFLLSTLSNNHHFTGAITVTENIANNICTPTTNPELCIQKFQEHNIIGVHFGQFAFGNISTTFIGLAQVQASGTYTISHIWEHHHQAYRREKEMYKLCTYETGIIKQRLKLAEKAALINNRGPVRLEANNSLVAAATVHGRFEARPDPGNDAYEALTRELGVLTDYLSILVGVCDRLPPNP